MKYVIMCGGTYTAFKTPKQLSVVNGERLADRTVRLLKEAGAKEIYISSNDDRFDDCGAVRIAHKNTFRLDGNKVIGYWLDAFYPYFNADDKVTYLYGDVYYTADAINLIVHYKTNKDVLFGTSDAKNEQHENWGEPFAYIVNDYKRFMDGVKAVKAMQDRGELKRVAITWELYRYLNGLDVNVQAVKDDTYVVIDDGTIDIDDPAHIEKMNGVIV